MIERLYLRHLLSFEEVELEFDSRLVVFTGPSGAGKSLLISAILSNAGYKSTHNASVCEVRFQKPKTLQAEDYELDTELIIKSLKKEQTRYYLNNQTISKKMLQTLFRPHIQYLSVRDKTGLEPHAILSMIDALLIAQNPTFKKSYKEYQKRFALYRTKSEELIKIKADEAKIAELIEFARYEIEKIEAINPKVTEESELIQIKRQLSHIDKLKASLQKASDIFNYEQHIEEIYRLLDKDVSYFVETMNQLRYDLEESETFADEIAEINVESVLDRLLAITALKNRYGSIEEALTYKENKKIELSNYQNIEQNKSILESYLAMESIELHTLATRLSHYRKEATTTLEKEIQTHLHSLKLPSLYFGFETQTMENSGIDTIQITLAQTSPDKLSGGEFNRLRLALMASTIQESGCDGVLILDEIDANVSGDESIAIARLINTLSKQYQIFAISHQPHLSALANQHIVVKKEQNRSIAIPLDKNGRIEEIARIISGETPTQEAINFAKKLLEETQIFSETQK